MRRLCTDLQETPTQEAAPTQPLVRLIALLGGVLERKGDGEPGVKTLWQGLPHVMDFAAGSLIA
jgi:hypothetical protein